LSRRPAGQADPHLVALFDPASLATDRYRMVRHAIELKHEEGLRVFAFTSPGMGDGKTTTVLNVAGVLSQDPTLHVLVVEADLRRPCMLERLGMPADGPGLLQVVSRSSLPVADAIRPVPGHKLWLAPAGGEAPTPYELLKSPRIWDFLQVVRERFDYVLIDTPPVLLCPDFKLLERWADASLLVVGANRTPRPLVAEAAAQLDKAKALGVVLNGADSQSGYGYAYASAKR
jgi:capsular exopolysaccharide synthesis family protein